MAQQSKELVKCHCSTCDNYLFTSFNAWSRLTDTYFTFSSDQPQDYSGTGLSPTFPNRAGSAELEGCEIQSLYCNQCSVQLGVKCITAPLLKIQHKYVLFFVRMLSMFRIVIMCRVSLYDATAKWI